MFLEMVYRKFYHDFFPFFVSLLSNCFTFKIASTTNITLSNFETQQNNDRLLMDIRELEKY